MSTRTAILALAFSLWAASCTRQDEAAWTDEAPSVEATVPQPAPATPLDSVLALAEARFRANDYTGASDRWHEVLERAGPEDALLRAKALNGLGLVAMYFDGDLKEARRLLESSLNLKVEHGLTEDLFSSHNNLGLLAWWENRLEDAQAHLKEAIRLGSAGEATGAAATARMNLALVQTEWGDFAAAREGFLALRDTMLVGSGDLAASDRAYRLGSALTNLGMLEVRTGNPAGAVGWLQEAVEVYREGSPSDVGLALSHLATAYGALGEQARAFSLLDSALVESRANASREEEAANLEVLAEQYREAGDLRRALSFYDRAKALRAQLGHSIEMGVDLRGEAEIHLAMGAPELARVSARDALTLHHDVGAALDELYDHIVLAEIADGLPDGDAVGDLAAAAELADALDVRSARLAVALGRSRHALRLGDPRAALQALREAADDLDSGGYDMRWQAHYLSSQALAASARTRPAIDEGWRAFETVQRVRDSYGSGILRTSFAAEKREVYSHLIGLLVRAGRIEDAFTVSEAARSRAIDDAPSSSPDSPTAELRLRQIERVLRGIDDIESGRTAVGGAADDVALAGLYARVADLRSDYEAAISRTQVSEAGTEQVESLAAAVQAALDDDEALIEYFVPRRGPVRIFVLRPSGLRVLDAGVTSESLITRARVARGLMSRPDEVGQSRTVLEGLHQALLGPVVAANALEGVRRITFVPHDALTYLPPAALRDPTTGRFFGEDFETSILPTAADLLLPRRADSMGAEGGTVFAPLPTELPGSREEADALRAARHATGLVGERATESRLRAALQSSDPVHIATHGILNHANPMFSRLVLAPGMPDDPANDGRLEVHELLDFRAHAPLVFLSGCETGIGPAGATRFSYGEDYATLGQALLRAGVGNVVATLWRVDDAAAAVFTRYFYEALTNRSPAASLRAAQERMRRDEAFSEPYYWAGYQLLGGAPHDRTAQ